MSRGPAAIPSADAAPASASVHVEGDTTEIQLAGRLDATTLATIWPQVIHALRDQPGVTRARVDGSQIQYCDGAGLALLVEIERIIRNRAGPEGKRTEPGDHVPVDAEVGHPRAEFVGFSAELSRLLERALEHKPARPPARPLSMIEQAGAASLALLNDLIAMVAFLGEVAAAFAWSVTHPRRIRWADVLLVAEKAGANAVPVVCLLGWLVGLIIAFQSVKPLQRYAAESTIPTMLSISLVRELGPLFTAIILAGRSGSAFAAEIGTMKVTEEINALTTFGLQPVRFLVVPRILAALVMTPLLSVLCTLAGLIGGYVVMAMLGFGVRFYLNKVHHAVTYVDLLGGLFKTLVFAFLVCGIGCLRGLRTASGPGAVGDSTTRAVVSGIVLVVVADGVLGVVYYFLRI